MATKIACEAQIGRPGAWHACRRRAVVKVYRWYGATGGCMSLAYCARHAARVHERSSIVTHQEVRTL